MVYCVGASYGMEQSSCLVLTAIDTMHASHLFQSLRIDRPRGAGRSMVPVPREHVLQYSKRYPETDSRSREERAPPPNFL
mmetsp:Transcript_21532/g.44346  ORF Transcript_21532/g.44346 Transcript_21532/m.44346 type:complete len:80 (+) Transcript_21532:4112-4351(+)